MPSQEKLAEFVKEVKEALEDGNGTGSGGATVARLSERSPKVRTNLPVPAGLR